MGKTSGVRGRRAPVPFSPDKGRGDGQDLSGLFVDRFLTDPPLLVTDEPSRGRAAYGRIGVGACASVQRCSRHSPVSTALRTEVGEPAHTNKPAGSKTRHFR